MENRSGPGSKGDDAAASDEEREMLLENIFALRKNGVWSHSR